MYMSIGAHTCTFTYTTMNLPQKKGANGMQVYYKSHARHLLTSVHLYAGTSLHQRTTDKIFTIARYSVCGTCISVRNGQVLFNSPSSLLAILRCGQIASGPEFMCVNLRSL